MGKMTNRFLEMLYDSMNVGTDPMSPRNSMRGPFNMAKMTRNVDDAMNNTVYDFSRVGRTTPGMGQKVTYPVVDRPTDTLNYSDEEKANNMAFLFGPEGNRSDKTKESVANYYNTPEEYTDKEAYNKMNKEAWKMFVGESAALMGGPALLSALSKLQTKNPAILKWIAEKASMGEKGAMEINSSLGRLAKAGLKKGAARFAPKAKSGKKIIQEALKKGAKSGTEKLPGYQDRLAQATEYANRHGHEAAKEWVKKQGWHDLY